MYIFEENKYPGIPEINLKKIALEPFVIGDIPVIPILVWHLHMPVLGFRMGKFTYITDANRIDDTEKEKIKGSDTMVLNALRHKQHISHFTLGEAVDMINELEIPNGYLTHISHQLGLYEAVSEELPSNIQIAYDGLQLSFE